MHTTGCVREEFKMSDYIVKLIPEQLQEVSEQQAAGLRAWLQHHIAAKENHYSASRIHCVCRLWKPARAYPLPCLWS